MTREQDVAADLLAEAGYDTSASILRQDAMILVFTFKRGLFRDEAEREAFMKSVEQWRKEFDLPPCIMLSEDIKLEAIYPPREE